MNIDVPAGEVLDRASILTIKRSRIRDPSQRDHVIRWLNSLSARWNEAGHGPFDTQPEWAELLDINAALWDVEDALRAAESRGTFDDSFIANARRVYQLNDRRASIKRSVSNRLNSYLIEQKQHP